MHLSRPSINKIIFSDCPTFLKISLQNVVKNKHSIIEGTYLHSDDKVNGRHYWNQEGKNNAIWYDTNKYWIVDDKKFLGEPRGLLWNTDSTAPCPTIGNWKFSFNLPWCKLAIFHVIYLV